MELDTISGQQIRILKNKDEIGASRDWLVGENDLENRILRILVSVFKISLKDLAKEVAMRPDSLRLVLRKLENRGLILVEEPPGNSEVFEGEVVVPAQRKRKAPGKAGTRATEMHDRTGRHTYIRYLGFEKEDHRKRDDHDIMYG
jgi:hypothetical protein